MSAAERHDVVGTHEMPGRALRIALTMMAVSAAALAAYAGFEFRRGGHPWPVMGEAVAMLALGFVLTSQLHSRTIVEPSGLKVRTGWQWRQIDWEEIDSFSTTSGGLASPEILTLRTTSGTKVVTQIPSRLQTELEGYATDHGYRGS